ncbi:hypothetical protein MASR2M18_06990 [Ignavibacteria bacterium]
MLALLFLTISTTGCLSIKERLGNAERGGRTADAFRLSVEYDDAERTDESRARMIRNANAHFDRLLQVTETHIDNNRFAAAYEILVGDERDGIPSVLATADRRNIQIDGRNSFATLKTLADARFDSYYNEALGMYNRTDFTGALYRFEQTRGLRESDRYAALCRNELQYSAAAAEFSAGNYRKAYAAFGKLPSDFKDAAAKRRESYERGKITVALYNFAGDDAQVLKNYMARTLSDEPFVEIIRINGPFRGVTNDIIQNYNEMLLVSGSVSSHITGPSFRQLDAASEAWIITGETREIIRKDGQKRYIRLAKPLVFTVGETNTAAKIKVEYEIWEAETSLSIYSNSRTAERNDRARIYTENSRYSSELFTVHNPVSDTLNFPITAWKPSDYDRKFQKNFLEKPSPLSPSVLLNGTLEDLQYDIAREVRQIIGKRLEGK